MKIGLLSLGCPKNLVDSEVMLGLVQGAGHQIVAEAGQADVLVINTCAFIDSAKQESIDAILEMAALRRAGPCRRLVVTGCLAERYRDELRREIPEIDVVLGTGEVPEIVAALGVRSDGKRVFPLTLQPTGATRPALSAQHPAPVLPTYLYDADTPRIRTTPRHSAYVKVAEGCDYACAFCVIPRLRGHYRSRPAESIVREAQALAESGVRELILISQDTTFYGLDRGERGALARLLRRLNSVDGLAWIRLLYLYPTTITDETLDAIAACERVCRYIDLPLQHASAPVLARMRRPGGRRTYEAMLRRIRDRLPGVTLRTTFIVGFPGETEADFKEVCDFVQAVGFDHVGVFTYSHEDSTAAFALADDIPPQTKERRRRELMRLQRRLVRRAHRRRIGQSVSVLIDGPSPQSPLVWQGRLEGQAPEVDPVVYLTECDPSTLVPGQLIQARIVDTHDYDLLACPLRSAENERPSTREAGPRPGRRPRAVRPGAGGSVAGRSSGVI